MNAIEAARRIGECLDEDGIPYAIGGALALGVWGVPRATKDLDLSVFVSPAELGRVLAEILAGRARVIGVAAIRGQSWKASPATVEPRRNLRPRLAARDEASRIAVLLGYRTFLAAYRDAHLRRAKGQPAVFPHSTYGLRRFGDVAIGPPLAS